MEGLTPNSYSRRLDSYISLENSKWLAENIEGVNEILRKIQRLTEDEYSEVKEAQGCHQQKPEVVAHATRICHMYKLLAERYDQLTEEVRLQIPSLLNVKHSAINDNGSEHVSQLQTPNQKLTSTKLKQDGNFKVYSSSGSGSPDLSGQNSSLLEENTKLNAIVKEFEAQIRSLQTEINCCKSETMEMQVFHDAQVINLQVDIENMKAEVKAKGEQVEALNKNLDMLKLKYDMLMANKDELDAKVENKNAELSSKNDEIREMNNHLYRLHLENVEMIAESERARKHEDELKEKVVELQNEVDRQVDVISVRAEEKREAIRQLCFSVEYYRNGYQELRQIFTGLKHHTVLASVKSLSKGTSSFRKDTLSSSLNIRSSTALPLSSVSTTASGSSDNPIEVANVFLDKYKGRIESQGDVVEDYFEHYEETCEQEKRFQTRNATQTTAKESTISQAKKLHSNEEVDAILKKENDLVNAHRKLIEETMDIVREEMNLLVQVDSRGNQLDEYIHKLNVILSHKAAGVVQLQNRLGHFCLF